MIPASVIFIKGKKLLTAVQCAATCRQTDISGSANINTLSAVRTLCFIKHVWKNRSADESNLNKSQVASKRSSEREYIQTMSFFGFIFTSEVELYMFHFINMDGLDFHLIWNRDVTGDYKARPPPSHTLTHSDPLSWAELDQPKKKSLTSIHLWFQCEYKEWIDTQRYTHYAATKRLSEYSCEATCGYECALHFVDVCI